MQTPENTNWVVQNQSWFFPALIALAALITTWIQRQKIKKEVKKNTLNLNHPESSSVVILQAGNAINIPSDLSEKIKKGAEMAKIDLQSLEKNESFIFDYFETANSSATLNNHNLNSILANLLIEKIGKSKEESYHKIKLKNAIRAMGSMNEKLIKEISLFYIFSHIANSKNRYDYVKFERLVETFESELDSLNILESLNHLKSEKIVFDLFPNELELERYSKSEITDTKIFQQYWSKRKALLQYSLTDIGIILAQKSILIYNGANIDLISELPTQPRDITFGELKAIGNVAAFNFKQDTSI